jgi:hypothetical protein
MQKNDNKEHTLDSLLVATTAQVDAFNEIGISISDYCLQQKSLMKQLFALGEAMYLKSFLKSL